MVYTKGLRCSSCNEEHRRRYIYRKKQEYKKMRPYEWVKELGGRGDSHYLNYIKKMKEKFGTNVHQIISRLMIFVKHENNFYYDIGIRKLCDPENILKKIVKKKENNFVQYREEHPRYLEDFIEYYGEKNIKILTPLRFEKEITIGTKEYNKFLNKYRSKPLKSFKVGNELLLSKYKDIIG